ncbi:hypothetical protein [Flavobacterium sp.]|uniref:hypothetical protein n=1 Tax=Flavobacterium sp. TaxID=239 RepID=UPI0039E39D37
MMKLISILFTILGFSCYSQTKVIKTFITKDSLTEITILDNNKARYIKYSRFSPIMASQRQIKSQTRSRCLGSFILDDQAYGNYEIKNDYLLLKFVEHKLDSLTVEYLPVQNNQNLITVTFSAKYEIFDNFLPVDIYIKEEDNGVELNNLRSENGEIKIELSEQSLPKTFIINNSQRIVIDKFQSQNIIYLKNYYKEFSRGYSSERKFKISELLLIK